MTDRACPSSSIGAHPCPLCVGERAFYNFTLWDETGLWVNSWNMTFSAALSMALQKRVDQQLSSHLLHCTHWNVSQVVECPLNCESLGVLSYRAQSQTDPCVLVVTSHSCMEDDSIHRGLLSATYQQQWENVNGVHKRVFIPVCLCKCVSSQSKRHASSVQTLPETHSRKAQFPLPCFMPASSHLQNQ